MGDFLGIEFDTSGPIYEQVIDHIKQKLIKKELNPGDKLPSQRELANELNLNPNTIQRCYREMQARGLAITKRGKGTFIKKSEEMVNEMQENMIMNAIEKFVEEMKGLGLKKDEIIKKIDKNLQIK